jgi:hypothetical protein
MLLVATPAAAQTPSVPAVDLSCSSVSTSGSIEIEVYPGSALSGYTVCRVVNPTAYIERVQIQVEAAGLTVSGAGTITVGANSESNVQITIRALPRMQMSSAQLKVTATVIEANGVPPQNNAQSEYTMIIAVMQFSRLQVEATDSFLQLGPRTDHNFEFKVYNQGNWADRFKVGLVDESRLKLEDNGFTISIPLVAVEIEPGAVPAKVRVMVRTPKNQGWSDEYHTLQFTAESEYSCRYEKGPDGKAKCNSETQSITIYVRGVYLPGFEIIPSLSMLGLAAAVIARRNLDDEEEFELREAAPGL